MKKFTGFQKRILVAVIIICVAVLGYFSAHFVRQQVRNHEFSELLLKTQMVALLVDQQDIEQLTGTPEDEISSVYSSLKKKLIRAKKTITEADKISLLGLNENYEQFYYLTSDLVAQGDYIQPGDINEEATRKDIADHINGATRLRGPYTSGTGEWVTTYAPVENESEEVIGLIRIDMQAQEVMLLGNILFRGMLLIASLTIFALLMVYISGARKLE